MSKSCLVESALFWNILVCQDRFMVDEEEEEEEEEEETEKEEEEEVDEVDEEAEEGLSIAQKINFVKFIDNFGNQLNRSKVRIFPYYTDSAKDCFFPSMLHAAIQCQYYIAFSGHGSLTRLSK